ncbi:MAG: hypothetical protein LBN04_03810 [Oscillospiraceae bacterium]|jgi:hypothetical protein|nr:hypothetical protein [Oscillospiraceae bacterium]
MRKRLCALLLLFALLPLLPAQAESHPLRLAQQPGNWGMYTTLLPDGSLLLVYDAADTAELIMERFSLSGESLWMFSTGFCIDDPMAAIGQMAIWRNALIFEVYDDPEMGWHHNINFALDGSWRLISNGIRFTDDKKYYLTTSYPYVVQRYPFRAGGEAIPMQVGHAVTGATQRYTLPDGFRRVDLCNTEAGDLLLAHGDGAGDAVLRLFRPDASEAWAVPLSTGQAEIVSIAAMGDALYGLLTKSLLTVSLSDQAAQTIQPIKGLPEGMQASLLIADAQGLLLYAEDAAAGRCSLFTLATDGTAQECYDFASDAVRPLGQDAAGRTGWLAREADGGYALVWVKGSPLDQEV